MIVKKLRLLGVIGAMASFAFLFSCGGGDDAAPGCDLDVLFSAPTTAITGQPLTLNNQTLNGVSYEWDFGDGSAPVLASTAVAPSYFYTTAGSYTVTLTSYCESGQTGTSGTYQSQITVTQSNPTAVINPFVFHKESDNAAVYPVAINFFLGNESTESNSYGVDWGDGSSDLYASLDDAPVHQYPTLGEFTITLTAYELPDQAGKSSDATFTVTTQTYNKLTATKFTLYPALSDSLGTMWDDGTNNDTDNDGTGADLLFLMHVYGSDFTAGASLYLLHAIADALTDVETITTATDMDINVEFNDGTAQAYWEFYAPKEPWVEALNPVFQSNNLGAIGWVKEAPVVGLWDLDGESSVFPIFYMPENDLVNASGSSYTWTNTNGDPLLEMHFTVEEQTGQ